MTLMHDNHGLFGDQDDLSLIRQLRQAADSVNHSPAALIQLGVSAAKWHSYSVLQASPPWPELVEESVVTEEHLAQWPHWVSNLVPDGSKWELLHWPDGSKTIRLMTPQGRVIAFAESAREEETR